ncbi:MAG TPA: ABC transporter permease, partial [Terriglobales bacterium]|nr:ABC transporter permease [Terriglobales bacterium]
HLRIAVYTLIALHAAIILGGFIAPYDYATQYRDYPFVPPMTVHFIDAHGHFHFRPFLYWTEDPSAQASQAVGQIFPIKFFVPGPDYKIAGLLRARMHLFAVDEPGKIFLLGTDEYGRDQLSRLLAGGQITLLAGFMAALLSIGLGLSFGLLAGYYGRLIDETVMRVAEIFMVLPWVYLLLAVKGSLPLSVSPSKSFLLVSLVIGILGWARPARLIRGVVLSAKERNYVLAARGFGASDLYILRRHIFPQTIAVVLIQATLLLTTYSLSEMTLSFLGLGVSEPVPSWGNMLASLQKYNVLTSYWWMFAPAVPAIALFWGYYTVANGLQESTQLTAMNDDQRQ